jgi:peptidyl-prolyl cis-trans isomerase SurA
MTFDGPALLTVLLLMAATGGVGQAEILERVVVKVNGDILTQRDVEERQLVALSRRAGREITSLEYRADPDVRTLVAEMEPQVIAEAIDEVLILQRAAELGLEATEQEVDRVLSTMRQDNSAMTDEQFDVLLRQEGLKKDMLRESIRRQILMEKLRQTVVGRMTVLEDEARAFYEARRKEFFTAAAVRFSEIVVELPPERQMQAEWDAAIVRFVKALDRVRAGQDFAEVARAYSDTASSTAGGQAVNVEDLPAPLRAALDRLVVGQVSPPVRIENTYRLLKLESITRAAAVPFEAARAQVFTRILERKQALAWEEQMQKLRAAALITWKDSRFRQAYEDYLRIQSKVTSERVGPAQGRGR